MNKILVGNNSQDFVHKVVTFNEAKEFADSVGIPFFEVSAKDSTNVEEIFTHLAQEIYNRVVIRDDNTPKEIEIEKEKQIELRTVEIEKLLKSLGMNLSQIPNSLLANDFQTFTFLNQLLKGKQNIRKQAIMIVGEGKLNSLH